jgi:putative hydrolase of the HAD superfamily
MITHIYFDWSGTLACSGSKDIITSNCNLTDKLATLFPDTISTLNLLNVLGYKIGIISNSGKSTNIMLNVLHELGIRHLFNCSIIFTNGKEIGKKPCKSIFNYALSMDTVNPDNAIMVGNDYEKDILGARSVGMKAVFIDRDVTSTNVDPYRINTLSELRNFI